MSEYLQIKAGNIALSSWVKGVLPAQIQKEMDMKNFRTFQLALSFYHASQSAKFKGAIRDQFQRASLSIVLNLAEARGKPTRRDQLKYFHIAMGSTRECQALLMVTGLDGSDLWTKLDKVAASLYRLIERAA